LKYNKKSNIKRRKDNKKRKSKHKKTIKKDEINVMVLTHELLASTLFYQILTPW
jgi:F0F1-type ATP synthase assembly protein I